MTRKDIQSLLATGRNLMPAASGLDDAMTHSLLDYLLFEPSVQEETPSPKQQLHGIPTTDTPSFWITKGILAVSHRGAPSTVWI